MRKYVRVNEEKLAAGCFDPQHRETRQDTKKLLKSAPEWSG
jgi:hypothetical protein